MVLKKFPYPVYNDDKFVAVVQALFPFIIILSFIFTVILTAKAIVYEKGKFNSFELSYTIL